MLGIKLDAGQLIAINSKRQNKTQEKADFFWVLTIYYYIFSTLI